MRRIDPTDEAPRSAPQERENSESVREDAPVVTVAQTGARRSRKVLLPHHYDPRPALFSGDALAAQRFWKIEPTRKLWTLADLDDLADAFGEPPLTPGVFIGEAVSDPSDEMSA